MLKSVIEHLEELRSCLIQCIIAIVIGSFVCFLMIDTIFSILLAPAGFKLIFLSPYDAFIATLKVSVVSGILITSPFLLLKIWRFFSSALRAQEQRLILVFFPISLILCFIGVVFAYVIVVPLSLSFLLSFGEPFFVPLLTVQHYFSYILTLLVSFAVIFQLPLVTFFLVRYNVISHAQLQSKRKHIIVVVLIFTALVTPPDVVSQIALAVPLLVLFELSVLIARIMPLKKKSI